MHVIAAKAVAFGEALRPEFKLYAQNVVANAKALAAVMIERGCAIVSGGTDNHLMLVDLRPKGVKGNAAAEALERAGITCNKNGVPFDPEKPTVTSGIRLGTPAGTTRGFGDQGVPGHRPPDQRRARRPGRRRQLGGRARGQAARRPAVRAVSDLRLIARCRGAPTCASSPSAGSVLRHWPPASCLRRRRTCCRESPSRGR